MKSVDDNSRDTRGRDHGRSPGPVAYLLIGMINIYRYTLSAFVGRTCRFAPTCSEYGVEAIRRHGAWRGGWLTFFRLTRCRPGAEHGYDPVPDDPGHHGLRFWRYAGLGPAKNQQAD